MRFSDKRQKMAKNALNAKHNLAFIVSLSSTVDGSMRMKTAEPNFPLSSELIPARIFIKEGPVVLQSSVSNELNKLYHQLSLSADCLS